MPSIRVLSADVAMKIAAGEVIERPASVVKELVENALDAGAKSISVELRGGGGQLIRVTDDGCGIAEDEVELAFERHATSKLSTVDDLFNIESLGFRGEALPSIRTVADVSILSRPADQEHAVHRRFLNGEVVERERRGGPPGTTISVRNLFAALPARLQYLRGAATESQHAVTVVTRYALAYPEVRFSVLVDGRVSLKTPGDGALLDAIRAIYGRAVAEAMVEVNSTAQGETRDVVTVTGAIAVPTVHRGNRSGISIFVNRRWVQNRMLTQAVEQAMQNRLMVGRYPVAVIHIHAPPKSIDPNVHPTKAEIRLAFERDTFSVIRRAAAAALDAAKPTAEWGGEPTWTPQENEEGPIVAEQGGEQLALLPTGQRSNGLPPLRVVGQVGLTYVILEGPDGMYMLDQHAAHERVLYEEIRAAWSAGSVDSQGLLDPITVEISPEQADAYDQHHDRLTELGFDVGRFGPSTVAVRAAPARIKPSALASVMGDVLQDLASNPAEWRDKAAASMACHSAIRAGQTLTDTEMRELVSTFERAGSPRNCPHGRPTIIHLSVAQLEREFGRR